MENSRYSFENVATNITNLNKFKHLSREKLIRKTEDYKNNKLKRYFYKHKGRTIIILFSIIILILCFTFAIPTDGGQDTTNIYTHVGSVLGFFASNIFLCLLLTVIGVETYFSRDEFEQLESALDDKIDEGFKSLQKKDDDAVIDKLQRIVKKIKGNEINDNKIKTYKIAVKTGNAESIRSNASNSLTYIEDLEAINEEVKDLKFNEKKILLEELNKIINIK